MAPYRLYFLDDKDGIQARQEFAAESDAHASIIGRALWQACTECYHDYELWQAARCLGRGNGTARAISSLLPAGDGAFLQTRVLELEERLLDSHWRVAQSQQLLAAVETLRRSLDGNGPPRAAHQEAGITPRDMMRYICGATGARMMSLQLAQGTRLMLRGSRGVDGLFDAYFAVVETDDCACGAAFKEARQIVVPALESSPIYAGQESLDILRAQGVAACVSTPFFGSDGAIAGMFSILRAAAWHPATGELAQLREIANQIAAALADSHCAAARRIRAAV